ncbi:MAG: hypothetical protein VW806_09390 [Halieaceae bacterium]
MTDHKDQPLSATAFEPAPTATATIAAEETPGGQPRWVTIGLALAIVLLLFVFLVLPRLVTPSDPSVPSLTTNGVTTEPARSTSAPALDAETGNGRSPFAEAQEGALRREAQEVLQALLTLQESLAERGAPTWGEPGYSQALAAAGNGDAAYRERDFSTATRDYQDALDQLVALEASLPERIEGLYATAVNEIERGELLNAQARYNALQEMAPDHSRLINLEARIAALPEVIAALASAADAEAVGDLSAAVAAAEEATRADPLHQRAQQRLTELRSALTRAQFTEAMSAGYGALSSQRFADAEAAFRTAAKLMPAAPEPGVALTELAQARTQATLIALREQGSQAESEERWADAVAHYENALEIDALMLFATDGIERAKPRAALDTRLDNIPKERDRLVDRRILAEAEASLAEAKAIANPGPRLQSQIAAAQETITYAKTPLAVSISSDGATDVTLLRVRRLGTLTQETLSLRPGTYTAVGIRDGFRDVRVTFDVRPNQDNAVTVRCVEAI